MSRFKIKRKFANGGYLTMPEPMKPPSTGAMTAKGAASGAAIGTQILPGWGTAIGAVVGGAAGFIGGKGAQRKHGHAMDIFNQHKTASELANERVDTINNLERRSFDGYKSGGKFKRFKLR